MERILNFRKLADGKLNSEGKSIRNIYRSADVSPASQTDIASLKEKDILNIIDLRSDVERAETPLLNDEKIEIKHVNIIDNARQNDIGSMNFAHAEGVMVELYRESFVNTDGFKTELEYIKSLNGKGFLFHCAAGKDRTGITGAILMYILGFSKEQIVEEYLILDPLLIDAILTQIKEKVEAYGIELDLEKVKSLACVVPEFINGYFEAIDSKYGNFDNYLQTKLEVTTEDIIQLKADYLV